MPRASPGLATDGAHFPFTKFFYDISIPFSCESVNLHLCKFKLFIQHHIHVSIDFLIFLLLILTPIYLANGVVLEHNSNQIRIDRILFRRAPQNKRQPAPERLRTGVISM